MLASCEYLERHNRALMVMTLAWAKEKTLLGRNVIWFQEKWKRRHVLVKSQAKRVLHFEFNLQKATTSRRPDLMLEVIRVVLNFFVFLTKRFHNHKKAQNAHKRTKIKRQRFMRIQNI